MAPSKEVVLSLHGLVWLSQDQRDKVVKFVQRDLEPLVKAAGRTLRINRGSRPAAGELNVYFERGEKPASPCGFEILGDDNSGYVSIAGHRHLRVCGPKNAAGERDTRRVLATDEMFSQGLANTALHELGHFIADFPDNNVSGNFMSTAGPRGQQRTLENMRKFFAGRLQWSVEQKEKLVECLKKGTYVGDTMVVQ